MDNKEHIRDLDKALNSEEVAALLGVDKRTVQRLVKRGQLTAFKAGRQLRYTRQAVDEYIRRNTIGGEQAVIHG